MRFVPGILPAARKCLCTASARQDMVGITNILLVSLLFVSQGYATTLMADCVATIKPIGVAKRSNSSSCLKILHAHELEEQHELASGEENIVQEDYAPASQLFHQGDLTGGTALPKASLPSSDRERSS